MRPAILRRRSLAYPGGASPGFNAAHPMAIGAQFSAVFVNGTFLNLIPGYAPTFGTIAGTSAKKIDGNIGPAKDVGTTYQVTFTTGAAPATTTPITMAAIVRTGTSDDSAFFSIGTSGPEMARYGGTSTAAFFFSTPPTDDSSGIALANTTPYFLAFSFQGFTNGTVNWVVCNLLNGKIQTANAIFGNNTNYGGTGYAIGFDSKESTYWQGRIAAVFHSINYHTLTDLVAWATDPWKFWFPESTIWDLSVLSKGTSGAVAAPPTGWMSAAADLPPRRGYVPGFDVGLLPIAPPVQFLAQGSGVELTPQRRLILPEGPTFVQPATAAGTPTPSVLWSAPDDNPRPKKPPLDPGAPLPLFQASTIVAPPNGWQSPGDQLPPRRPVNNEAGLLPIPPAPTLWYLAAGEQLPPLKRPPTDAAGLVQPVSFTPVSGMAWAGTPGDNVVSRPLTWLLSSTAFSPQVIAPPPPPPSGVHYITTSRGKLIAVIGVS